MENQQQIINICTKSLSGHINDIINMLDYSDFSPEIDSHALLEKFQRLMKENNCYWVLYIPEDKWTRWLFIQFKSFETSKPVRLGLHFDSNTIGGYAKSR